MRYEICDSHRLMDIEDAHFTIKFHIKPPQLQAFATSWLCSHFSSIAAEADFHQLPETLLSNVLTSDQLCADSELQVLTAVCSWGSRQRQQPHRATGFDSLAAP
jgi:hypothetical protein